ncbi:diguanylate cyclase (GGDEF domain) [hydrothermal vent metagenome]|uniref:Diguanylate cyclase (GGDEF domain) n=1 Tax=hydrothermal vent metagenome TaxID=652676 RepID=A0A1W1BCC1_9ZZZZ
MSIKERELEILSNEVKNSIEELPIVTPSVYRSIFEEYAKKDHIKIDNEVELSENIVTKQCSKLTTLQDETYKNANHLSEHTSKAIDAIQSKDTASLQQILLETKKLREEVEELRATLYRDELTHALNRKWLRDKCLHEGSNSFSQDGVLAIIDLNYFKKVNDTHGHIIGDKVLIFIFNELRRIGYPVIRYGGDEFIILFRNFSDITKAKNSLEQLRESIIKKRLKTHNKATFTVSFSFGLAAFKEGDFLDKTIEEADKNMYKDKIQIKKRITSI